MLNDISQAYHRVNIVAELSGKVVGASFGHKKAWAKGNVLVIEEIFVDPEVQGNGIGNYLINKQTEGAKVLYDASDIELVTLGDRRHPKEWYQKLGLQVEDGLIIMGGSIEGTKLYLEGKIRRSKES